MNAYLNKKEETIMSLVHYFVTEENYTPINVQGAQNEIWLENLENPYKIVRINSNYIHNNEQYDLDILKMNFVIKQIKKKTLSLSLNTVNICLDLNDKVDIDLENKSIYTVNVTDVKDLNKNKKLVSYFPNMKKIDLKKPNNFDNIIHITEDINSNTEKENKKFEDIFKPKKIVMTKVIMGLYVFFYLFLAFITSDYNFLIRSIIPVMINLYSLWVIGSQVETYFGKFKFSIIYFSSVFIGCLFSIILKTGLLFGINGAIFGLIGSLLYFGYHYRLYLGNALKNEIIPIIIINLLIGFLMVGVSAFVYIGSMVGGYISTMMVGLKYKSTKKEMINGGIVYTLLVAFLIYVIFKLV